MTKIHSFESPSEEISAFEIIKGQDIRTSYTLKTMYDNNSIGVYLNGNKYRMHISTVLQMIQKFEFLPVKKKVHIYLEINDGTDTRQGCQ